MVRSIHCSYRVSGFDSQHPCSDSQPFILQTQEIQCLLLYSEVSGHTRGADMPAGDTHTDKTQNEKSEWNERDTQPQPVILRESSLEFICSRVSSSGAGESETGERTPCPWPPRTCQPHRAQKVLNQQPGPVPQTLGLGCFLFKGLQLPSSSFPPRSQVPPPPLQEEALSVSLIRVPHCHSF